MPAEHRIRIARIYDDIDPDDGTRVLVDRLWPRGVSKTRAQLDEWCRDIAPSTGLREWYHHEPELFDEFASRYEAELADCAALEELRKLTTRGVVTLVSSTRSLDISHAAVLAKLLKGPQ